MDIQIVPKGETIAIKDKSGVAFTGLYVGAGWDMVGAPVDLDLVAACLINGKLVAGGTGRLVYFGDKTENGVTLGADNRSGEGDGDDESIVIDLTKVDAEVDSIALGVVAYSGSDLAASKNVHFRVCNGSVTTDPQVFDVKMENASTGDTVLHAATLKRGADGWTIENVSKFYQKGNGTQAVQGFANLFA